MLGNCLLDITALIINQSNRALLRGNRSGNQVNRISDYKNQV
jgi:hypothetical protein